MRRFLFNLHLCLALGAGIFILVMGITGAIMAFEPELDRMFHRKVSYVTPQGSRLTLAELGDAVHRAYPRRPIMGYAFPPQPNLAWAVALQQRSIFINPYNGEILGERPFEPDFLGYVHQTHLRLAIRSQSDPGKKIMSWAGMLVLILLLSGLYLWWPLKRVSIRGSKVTRRFWFDLHNSVGIFSFLFLLLLTLTGVVIGFEDSTVPLLYRLTGSSPTPRPALTPMPPNGALPIGPDRAVEIARTAIPGAEPFQINVPGPRGAYIVRSRFPEDRTPGGRSTVVVEQYTGRVIFAEGSRTAPAGARMVIANRAIHTGDLFGIPTKTVMSVASLALVAQVLTGGVMWWKRRRATRRQPAGSATPSRLESSAAAPQTEIPARPPLQAPPG
ncbi:MAG TPA: PepSY domain-containing protein [Bryobacteraceae bacterium]|jgi:uncharacterized iron-regulated membrane protein